MKKMIIGAFAMAASISALAADQAVVDRYNTACMACHMSGAAGAPKFGSAAEWEPRLAKGMDALVQSVKTGLNAMPAGGLCPTCTDDEYKALIEYMSTGK